ncbi:MAG: LL-diaminopimelate aminotransferase [Muribaculaceae bacterium]|nr:LL-diaminopimelate aminotransferase [Muribaculaceae bacterium]
MYIANQNFARLPESYLFSEVARKIKEYKAASPHVDVIRMDIGDVSLPLPACVVEAMVKAAQEMGRSATFHGYGPEQGYPFLREAVAEYDYRARGIDCIEADDIFISDGAKSDLANLGDIFGQNLRPAVVTPAYPVYIDSNVLSGRGGTLQNGRWSGITYLPATPPPDFAPALPAEGVSADVIYLCYPNNPTGAVITMERLRQWVEYARSHGALIIFDSAYEAYISTPGIPHSIYEVEGADEVAIEVRSFSKTAGFTGVRCGYTVVPRRLKFTFVDGTAANLNRMWSRRQCTKFNGVGYVVQRAAEALYTPEGREAIRENVGYYMRNAAMLRTTLLATGAEVSGGLDAPYVWFRPAEEGDSWTLFERMLHRHSISSTPGVGFGREGEGWLRLTGFNTEQLTIQACDRLRQP